MKNGMRSLPDTIHVVLLMKQNQTVDFMTDICIFRTGGVTILATV